MGLKVESCKFEKVDGWIERCCIISVGSVDSVDSGVDWGGQVGWSHRSR